MGISLGWVGCGEGVVVSVQPDRRCWGARPEREGVNSIEVGHAAGVGQASKLTVGAGILPPLRQPTPRAAAQPDTQGRDAP